MSLCRCRGFFFDIMKKIKFDRYRLIVTTSSDQGAMCCCMMCMMMRHKAHCLKSRD